MDAFLEQHLRDTMVSKIQRETLLCNLQKSDKHTQALIEADYKRCVGPIKKPRWKRGRNNMQYLEDASNKRKCVLFPRHLDPCWVLNGGQAQIYDTTRHQWTSPDLPQLGKDVISRILGHLPGQDLLSCRLVCKMWNKVASRDVYWKQLLKQFSPRMLEPWKDLPLYIQYVQQTKFEIDTLAKLCLRSVAHFRRIFRCSYIAKEGFYHTIPEPFRVGVYAGRQYYWIPMDRMEICSGDIDFNLIQFLDEYKAKLI